jgi:hypothetical protein
MWGLVGLLHKTNTELLESRAWRGGYAEFAMVHHKIAKFLGFSTKSRPEA